MNEDSNKMPKEEFERLNKFIDKEEKSGHLDTSFAKLREKVKSQKEDK